MSELESLEPACTVRMYPEVRQDEPADWMLKFHKCRLRAFVEWCEGSGVDDLTELGGRSLHEFRVWRREGNSGVEDGKIPEETAPAALKSQLTTLRAPPRFAANIHTAPEDFYERVPLPKLSGTDDVSDSTFEPGRVADILEYLHRYHYASRWRVEFALLRETGARMGTIRGLDLCDLDLNGRMPVVRYKYRPDQGAPIKNGEEGGQFNSVSNWVGIILQAYIDGPCVDKTDEFGRKLLLTTSHGRVPVNTIRQGVRVVTRPCWLNQGCPHNRDIETYEAVKLDHVSTCPSSRSLHDIRGRVVTLYRREEVPHQVASDHLDVSDLVLDKHYDRRGERERAEQRWNHLPWQNNEYSTYPNARDGLYTPFTKPL